MSAVIEIYGPYKSEALKKITYTYLRENFQEPELENKLATLIKRLNPKYKTPPSPADFEEIFTSQTDLEGEAQEWFNKLNATGNSLDNIIVSNVRAHKALESTGGWVEFCRRNPEYDHLNRKRFVEAYIKATPEGTPRLMYGESAQKYNKQPLMFGDPAACRDALEYHKNPADEAVNKALNFIENRRI
jgi:hypothetical protein